jgi:hypothetical protein
MLRPHVCHQGITLHWWKGLQEVIARDRCLRCAVRSHLFGI